MNEQELLELWNKTRLHIIISQIAPTFLLIVTVGLMPLGLGAAPLFVKFAALGILLASGILGALIQYSSASDGLAVAKDLSELSKPSHATKNVVAFAPWLNVVRFVTPAIFIVIFVFLALAILA